MRATTRTMIMYAGARNQVAADVSTKPKDGSVNVKQANTKDRNTGNEAPMPARTASLVGLRPPER